MKLLKLITGLAVLTGFCGCATKMTINAASGFAEVGAASKAQPAYYLLVPVTVPIDIVGTPFFYLLWAAHTEDASCGKFFALFFR
jgi:hypothetical protein